MGNSIIGFIILYFVKEIVADDASKFLLVSIK